MATVEDIRAQRLEMQAKMEELQRQEDAARAAADLVDQGQPLNDALQRATTAEARVEQLATLKRRLERTNIQQRQQIEELTGRLTGTVQTVLDGVAQSADALTQASSNMKSFSGALQSVVEALTRGIAAKQDTSTVRTSGTCALSHAHVLS